VGFITWSHALYCKLCVQRCLGTSRCLGRHGSSMLLDLCACQSMFCVSVAIKHSVSFLKSVRKSMALSTHGWRSTGTSISSWAVMMNQLAQPSKSEAS
jgi:hypothetical protein